MRCRVHLKLAICADEIDDGFKKLRLPESSCKEVVPRLNFHIDYTRESVGFDEGRGELHIVS